MKPVLPLLILILTSFNSISQESGQLNIGISYPVFFKSSLYVDNNSNEKTWISGINTLIEYPGLLKFSNQKIHAVPGIMTSFYNEESKSPSSALGGQSSKSFKHSGFSIYNKFLYDFNSSPGRANLQMGIIAGAYVLTKTKGQENYRSLMESRYHSQEDTYDMNGKIFFNSFYAGLVARFESNNKNLILDPKFELAFFPSYAKLLEPGKMYMDLDNSNSMLSVSFIFGINGRNREE